MATVLPLARPARAALIPIVVDVDDVEEVDSAMVVEVEVEVVVVGG